MANTVTLRNITLVLERLGLPPPTEQMLVPDRMRTQVPFQLGKDTDEDKLIRTVTYYRKEYERLLAWFDPDETAWIRSALSEPFASPATAKVRGDLPVEVISQILGYLDIASIFCFRQVNRQARGVVSKFPLYRAILKYGMNTILFVLKTGTARWFTLEGVKMAISAETCFLCDRFAGFLFVLRLKRICFECLEKDNYHDLRLAPCEAVNPDPRVCFRTVPGVYGKPYPLNYAGRGRYISLDLHPSYYCSDRCNHDIISDNYRYMAAIAQPVVNFTNGPVPRVWAGVSCIGCQIAYETPGARRITALNGKVSIDQVRDRGYSRDGYMEHFKWCSFAQRLWQDSQGGTVPVQVPDWDAP